MDPSGHPRTVAGPPVPGSDRVRTWTERMARVSSCARAVLGERRVRSGAGSLEADRPGFAARERRDALQGIEEGARSWRDLPREPRGREHLRDRLIEASVSL